MDDYEQDFVNGDEGARKEVVKRLTRKIGTDVTKMTVNAPDWYVVPSSLQRWPADR